MSGGWPSRPRGVRSDTLESHGEVAGVGPSIGVCVTPGPMALPLMPRGPHSHAATLTSMLRAAFDAQNAPMVRSTRCALTLLVATIEPEIGASAMARANPRR